MRAGAGREKGAIGLNSINDIWAHVLEALGRELSSTALNTWFSDCAPRELTDSRLIITTPEEFKKGIITSRFSEKISACLSDLFSADLGLTVMTDEEYEVYEDNRKGAEDDLPFVSDYTFDNFVVGPSNKFAHAAALAVSENPGATYNPLFIYGSSGLGKTHLLLAIGQAVHASRPKDRIVYVNGEDFTNELVHCIQTGSMKDFREKYRQNDLLLMDDIQFIAGKQQTQEEFFHTFNALYGAKTQIVVTSDRPPIEIGKLEERIRTRLEWGLLADVQPPDLETRMAIIRSKAVLLGLVLTDEIVEYIAQNTTSNVRQIEGVIHKLTAFLSLMDTEPTISLVDRAIKEVNQGGVFVPTPELIITETARYFGIPEDLVIGQNRQKNISYARQVAMYLCRTLINTSLEDIGSRFDNRNHSTVLTSIRKIEDLVKTSPDVAAAVRDITSNISAKNRN